MAIAPGSDTLRHWFRSRSTQEQQLLLLAGLPLIDGVFLSAVASGLLSDPSAAVAIGVNLFSGAGCLAIALSLTGPLRQRVGLVLRVYGFGIFPVAAALAASSSTLRGLMLPHFDVFSALVLIGLALEIAGLRVAPGTAQPATIAAGWSWAARLTGTPQVVLAVAVAASMLYAVKTRPPIAFTVSVNDAGMAALAVLAGMALTLVGVVFGGALRRRVDSVWIRRGGALGLVAIAACILGAPLPNLAPLAPLLVCVAFGSVTRARAEVLSQRSQGGRGRRPPRGDQPGRPGPQGDCDCRLVRGLEPPVRLTDEPSVLAHPESALVSE
jgi:hypothetical protein